MKKMFLLCLSCSTSSLPPWAIFLSVLVLFMFLSVRVLFKFLPSSLGTWRSYTDEMRAYMHARSHSLTHMTARLTLGYAATPAFVKFHFYRGASSIQKIIKSIIIVKNLLIQ